MSGRLWCEETLDIAVAMMTGKRENDAGAAGSRALTPNSATQPSTLLSDTNLRMEMAGGVNVRSRPFTPPHST